MKVEINLVDFEWALSALMDFVWEGNDPDETDANTLDTNPADRERRKQAFKAISILEFARRKETEVPQVAPPLK